MQGLAHFRIFSVGKLLRLGLVCARAGLPILAAADPRGNSSLRLYLICNQLSSAARPSLKSKGQNRVHTAFARNRCCS
jgi:hypothetical protein